MNKASATSTAAPLRDPASHFYPEIEPFDVGRLKVSSIHDIHYEQSGNPNGKPVVFFHGGPGSGTDPKMRRYFDPRKYRVVLFDQRGCGKSTPFACLDDNTTWDLVDDAEKLRKKLGISKWQVFGGSWGSALALAYSESHPEAVTELVLRGIFMLRKWEIDWFYQKGADAIYPDAWEEYLAPIPEAERGDLVAAYYKRLTSSDEKIRLAAAKAWSIWEGKTSKLLPDAGFVAHYGSTDFATAFARIECHYFTHNGFFKSDDELIRNIGKIRHIPAVIVQGRYDVVCPMRSAWDLHKAWPEADLQIIPDAGHSAGELSICRALIAATDRFSTY